MTDPSEQSSPAEPTATPATEEAATSSSLGATWTPADLLGDWRNYRRGTIPAAYRRVGDRIELRGAICGGRKGSTALVLPERARPPGLTVRPMGVASEDRIDQAAVYIGTAGSVVIVTDNWGALFYDLGGVSFLVDPELARAIEAERLGDEASRAEATEAAKRARMAVAHIVPGADFHTRDNPEQVW